jgi:hypothetical protein
MTTLTQTLPTINKFAHKLRQQQRNIGIFGFSDADLSLIKAVVDSVSDSNGLALNSDNDSLFHAFVVNAMTREGKQVVEQIRRAGTQRLIVAIDSLNTLRELNIAPVERCLIIQFPLTQTSLLYCLGVLNSRMENISPIKWPSQAKVIAKAIAQPTSLVSATASTSRRYKLKSFPPMTLLAKNPNYVRASSFLLSKMLSIDEVTNLSGLSQSQITELINLCLASNLLEVCSADVMSPQTRTLKDVEQPSAALQPNARPPLTGFLNKLRAKLGLLR